MGEGGPRHRWRRGALSPQEATAASAGGEGGRELQRPSWGERAKGAGACVARRNA
jgi:hypothetical protein